MNLHSRVFSSVVVAALATTLAACSSTKSKTATTNSTGRGTSSAGTPTTTDYSRLLIAAADIPVAGFTRQQPQPTPQGNGTTVSFTEATGNRTLGDTILVFSSSDAATTAAQASATAAKSQITGGQSSSPNVGSNSTLISGTDSNGAATLLIFTEGRTEVVLEFTSPASDPVPASVVQQVGTKQDELVKSNPPQ